MNKYRNSTDKMLENLTFINRPCFYKTRLSKEIKFAIIKSVEIYLYAHGERRVLCMLDNDLTVVMHCDRCPNFIGSNVWGFLSKAECEEYWDM